jgi:hypothetical protein
MCGVALFLVEVEVPRHRMQGRREAGHGYFAFRRFVRQQAHFSTVQECPSAVCAALSGKMWSQLCQDGVQPLSPVGVFTQSDHVSRTVLLEACCAQGNSRRAFSPCEAGRNMSNSCVCNGLLAGRASSSRDDNE